MRASHKDLRKRYEHYWLGLLGRLQQRGEIRAESNLQRTVFFLFGAMNWTTEWYDEKKSSLTVVAGELADLVANGLQPQPSERPSRQEPQQGKS